MDLLTCPTCGSQYECLPCPKCVGVASSGMMDLPPHIHAAIDSYIPRLHGWTTVKRAQEMAACVLELRHSVAVSIGVYAGRSALAMGFAMREIGKGMVYGIDPYRVEDATEGNGDEADKDWWKEKARLNDIHLLAMETIWAHRIEPWLTIIRAASQHVYQLFPEIGVLEIDGNHSEEASCRDVNLYLPAVIKGGYIFADDCAWPTTQKAMAMLDEKCERVSETKNERECYRIYRKR